MMASLLALAYYCQAKIANRRQALERNLGLLIKILITNPSGNNNLDSYYLYYNSALFWNSSEISVESYEIPGGILMES